MDQQNIAEKFIVTSSNDCDIELHRLDNGVLIGRFGHSHPWNILDVSAFDNKRPRLGREWYLKLKAKWKVLKENKLK